MMERIITKKLVMMMMMKKMIMINLLIFLKLKKLKIDYGNIL